MRGPIAAVELSMAASMDGTLPGFFEIAPFFPAARGCGPLLERAAALVAEGHRLEASSGPLAAALRPLLCTMNACYASELDGRPLRPADIERAIPASDSNDPGAQAHHLGRTHAAAEAALVAALPTKSVGLYAPEFVQCIHAELHRTRSRGRSIEADVDRSEDASPPPGAWRLMPAAGREAAPASAIPELMDTWQGVYSKPFPPEQAIIAALCSQHRLLGVRPFQYGNGRTARLHTHLVLSALGLTRGLWSPLRGMARDRDGYQGRLGNALSGHEGQSDRSTAVREALEEFTAWTLDRCLEQARAARDLLDGERLKGRLHDLLAWLGARPWVMGSERSVIKPDALEALHYAAITGPVERARFIAMLGLQHRTGRRVLSSLLDFGLLVSESSRAPVRFHLPLSSLRFLFPGVWPEAVEADEPHSAAWSSAGDERSSDEPQCDELPSDAPPSEAPPDDVRPCDSQPCDSQPCDVLPRDAGSCDAGPFDVARPEPHPAAL
jgi:Fic family protein